MKAPPGDGACVSVAVRAKLADAFALFTEEIDAWWRHGSRFRVASKQPGTLRFAPGLGGQLIETVRTRAGDQEYVLGTITAWEPPQRLVFEWRGVNFRPEHRTEVEVTFTELGATTLVTVRHRGWSTLPNGHPAKHGLIGAELSRMIGLWWGDLLSSLRELADGGPA